MPEARIQRYADRGDLAAGVAERLLGTLVDLQSRQSLAQVCLCAGETAHAVYQHLARLVPYSALDPGRLELWWSDETYLATEEQGRYASDMLSVLAGAFPLDPARTHPMPARTGHHDVGDAASSYAAELGGTKFDLCLLSLGQLGHVASIFPGSAAATMTQATVVGVTDSPIPPMERVTISLPLINRSRAVWVMASGALKAEITARVWAPGAGLPASLAHGTDETRWFIDADAASGLPYYRCTG